MKDLNKIILVLITLVILLITTGCEKEISTTQPEGNLMYTPQFTIEFSEDGLLEKMVGIEIYFEFSYDSVTGVLNGVSYWNKESNELISEKSYVNEYDEQNRLVKSTKTIHYGQEVCTYEYNENGLLFEKIEGVTPYEGEPYTITTNFYYDKTSRFVYAYTNSSIVTNKWYKKGDSIFYNAQGLISRIDQYNNARYGISLHYVYDENSNLLKQHYYYGNYIDSSNYDKYNRPVSFYSGSPIYGEQIFTYNRPFYITPKIDPFYYDYHYLKIPDLFDYYAYSDVSLL